jgi:hypothetical protein
MPKKVETGVAFPAQAPICQRSPTILLVQCSANPRWRTSWEGKNPINLPFMRARGWMAHVS